MLKLELLCILSEGEEDSCNMSPYCEWHHPIRLLLGALLLDYEGGLSMGILVLLFMISCPRMCSGIVPPSAWSNVSTLQAMSYFSLSHLPFGRSKLRYVRYLNVFCQSMSQPFRTIKFQEIGRAGFAPLLSEIQDLLPDAAALNCQILCCSRRIQFYPEHYLHSASLGYENAPLLPSIHLLDSDITSLPSLNTNPARTTLDRGLLCCVSKGLTPEQHNLPTLPNPEPALPLTRVCLLFNLCIVLGFPPPPPGVVQRRWHFSHIASC